MARRPRNGSAERRAAVLELSDDALAVAEGWSILPAAIQRHFKLLIDEYIANQSPVLREMYDNAREPDQVRFNRIVEEVQARLRGTGPGDTV